MDELLSKYQALHQLATNLDDPLGAAKVGLLIAVVVAVGWRLAFAWMAEVISGPEVLVLTISLLTAEGAAVRWLPDFDNVHFALLVAIPASAWAGVGMLSWVSNRESYRSDLNKDVIRLRAAIKRDPLNAAAHEFLGDAYWKLGQQRRGTSEYRAAVALEPGSYRNRYKLERAARLAGVR